MTVEPDLRTTEADWTVAQRVGFRLLFSIGMGLVFISVFGSMLLNPVMLPVHGVLARVGAFVTHTPVDVPVASTQGDSLGTWQYHIGWSVAAVVTTVVWSALDRGRTQYRSLGGLLWHSARIALACGMIFYGLAKTIPSQMGYMSVPAYALQPVGDVNQMNMLWGFMGASPGYSITTGLVELGSGLLLLSRRTWIVGALGSIVSMAQVTVLDTFYNVPVKFLAFEFLVIALAILAPQWRNLINVALGRPASRTPEIWRAAGVDRTWVRRTGKALGSLAVLTTTGLATVGATLSVAAISHTHSTVDGTWTASSFRVNGHDATIADSPWVNIAITDRGRGALRSFAAGVNSLVTSDPSARVTAWHLDIDDDRLIIRKRQSDAPAELRFLQPDPDRLTLTGRVEGRVVTANYVRRPMARESEQLRFTHPSDPRDQPVPNFP